MQVIFLKLEQFMHFLEERYITKRQYFCIAFQKNAKKLHAQVAFLKDELL